MIETNEELITQKVAQSLDFTLNPLMEPEKRKSPPASIKKKIESSHGRLCPLCEIKMVHTPNKGAGKQKDNEATWEHVLDLSLGGSNHLENSTIICFSCNAANNSVMLEYIGQFGLRFGNLEWKEEFNRDRRNLVRLHRFVDWKTRSVLSGRTDVYQEMHRMWSRYRWGNSVYVNDSRPIRTHVNDSRPIRTHVNDSRPIRTHGRGVIRRIFDNILSLFQRDENVIPEIADTPSVVAKPASTTIIPEEPTAPSDNQEMRWTDLDKGSLDDLGKLLVHLIGEDRMRGTSLGHEISQFQKSNGLSGAGSKDLFREFGIAVTSKTTLKGMIVENFSGLIDLDEESPAVWYCRVVVNKGKHIPRMSRKKKLEKRQEEIKIQAKREASEIIERITGRKPPSTTIIPEEPTVPSDNQEMRWTDLDKGSLDDLGKLLVHLIGSERMIMSILGSEIAKFQSRNNLSGSGSKDLFREFGITVTSKTTLKGVIVENFSDLIHVDQVSPVQCYYSVVDKQDLLTIPLPTR